MALMMDNENKQIIKNSFLRKNILIMLYYYPSLFFLIFISSWYLSVERFRKDEIVLPVTIFVDMTMVQHYESELPVYIMSEMKKVYHIFRWITDTWFVGGN